jgi:hypothetical protein
MRRARSCSDCSLRNSATCKEVPIAQGFRQCAHRARAGLGPTTAAEGGYDFQDWFYDGSLTLDGTTHLNELKFAVAQADATDIDSLRAKVDDKADNTMGIMISMSGYSSVAISRDRLSGHKLLFGVMRSSQTAESGT